MTKVLSSIACNLDSHILLAALPLLEAGKVQAVEWSFDTLFQYKEIPDWFRELLKEFGEAKRLVGHGVFFSLFSGKWSPSQADWLAHLEKMCAEFHFDHITEHFGFMTGADFHAGAPISLPFTPSTLAIGRDRLKRIQAVCHCPVGLENLAFSYSLEEVKKHGEFLEQLVAPVNGFIILDLHNLYCQLHNFDLDFEELIGLYPLERVREIHISGGSWEDSMVLPGKTIRRDTHDDSVPKAVFTLLQRALPLCPNLKYVVMEQLGNGLLNAERKENFQKDFLTLDRMLEQHNLLENKHSIASFLPATSLPLGPPLEDAALYQQQLLLSHILENANDCSHAQQLLYTSELANSAWQIEQWQPCMLETALRIAQKWKK